MRKQRFKCHGFGFDLQTYQKLRDYGFGNQAIQVLSQSPSKFFANFKKHARHIPESQKNSAYMFCLQAVVSKTQERRQNDGKPV